MDEAGPTFHQRAVKCDFARKSRHQCHLPWSDMMSDNLLSSACETDVCGTLSMHMLQLASGTPSALLMNNNYGTDPNKACCFHCSNPAAQAFLP